MLDQVARTLVSNKTQEILAITKGFHRFTHFPRCNKFVSMPDAQLVHQFFQYGITQRHIYHEYLVFGMTAQHMMAPFPVKSMTKMNLAALTCLK